MYCSDISHFLDVFLCFASKNGRAEIVPVPERLPHQHGPSRSDRPPAKFEFEAVHDLSVFSSGQSCPPSYLVDQLDQESTQKEWHLQEDIKITTQAY